MVWRSAKDRAKALVDAGADAIFPEAMRSLEEFAAVRNAVDVPILANMTEFGKLDLFSVDELRDVGVNIVIWPVSMSAHRDGRDRPCTRYAERRGASDLEARQMQHRADLYDLIDYELYNHFDSGVFNFTINR